MSEFNSMEDLAFSRSFRNWVLKKDAAEKGFWENWVARNPEKAQMVKHARAIIYALYGNTTVLSEDEIDEEVRKALVRLREAPRYIPLEGTGGRMGRWTGLMRSQRLWSAAALVAGLALGGYFIYRVRSHRDVLATFLRGYKKEAVHEEAADAEDDQSFNLPDGSLVRLGKTGKLYYAANWASGMARREVYLRGQAFFDIRKGAGAPFYVYTDQVIVRALGTSFVVSALPADTRTTVTAVTGKVLVYRQEDFFAPGWVGHEQPGMILTPNQESIYDRAEDRMRRTLTGAPEQIEEKPDTSEVFVATPARQVFGRLQELYGVPIRYDEELGDKCLVTASLGNESFFDKLTIICTAIRGSYEVIDGNVVVTAPGCSQGRSGGGPAR